jgi:hypothetical protein
MKETLRHKEAFEHYYVMGASRNLASLARDCKVSEKSVKTWSGVFDWQARIEQRDIENSKRLQKATDDTVVSVKAKYRRIVGAAIGDFVSRFKAGQVAIDSVSDLERLIKLDLLLMGEATEAHAHTHSFEEMLALDQCSPDELARHLADAATALAAVRVPPSA